MRIAPDKDYPEIHNADLTPSGRGQSRAVSHEEFQNAAAQGHVRHQLMAAQGSEPTGLHKHWDKVVEAAHKATREPWGGITVNAHTGETLDAHDDSYALSARDPGVSEAHEIPAGASRQHFGEAMERARETYHKNLSAKGAHLGVFHDADKGTIDIDPITVVHDKRSVEQIGAYTHAVGGAYHFKSGNGYWPPHVAQEPK